MANKETFDLVIIEIGYRKLAMPKEAAMAFFNAICGHDVYEMGTHWDSVMSNTVSTAKLLDYDSQPLLRNIGPVHFHAALEAQRDLDRAARAKAKKEETP